MALFRNPAVAISKQLSRQSSLSSVAALSRVQGRVLPLAGRAFSDKNSTQTFDYNKKNEGKSSNIVWSEGLISNDERVALTGQRGATLWITGLSGSGKSTIACALEHRLLKNGVNTYRLDGDNIRFGLCKDLGFTAKDREENIRRIGEVAKLMTDSGCITITAFISPYQRDRDLARKLHENSGLKFLEVLMDVPLAVAEQRDPKGLYKKARAGLIKGFTGNDDPYELPEKPELVIPTHEHDVDESVDIIMKTLTDHGVFKKSN